jgi:hypothetical protein
MVQRPLRFAALLAVLALVGAACGDNNSGSKESKGKNAASENTSAPAAEKMPGSSMPGAGGEEMMPLPPGADNMKIAITSPAGGTKVTGNAVTLKVAATGYDLTCNLAGKPEVVTTSGHYHVLIDKSLVNMYCTPDATVSMQNVKPGMHTLAVVPTLNDHAEVLANEQTVTIDYEPTKALPEIRDATAAAKPAIKIMSPKPGETVKGAFDVVVDVSNFKLSCDLYGKPGVAGYGHWHVNADSSTGPMMGMGTMFGMSCARVFHATTDGLKSGEKHSIIALLVDNGHAPLMPANEDKVDVTIG